MCTKVSNLSETAWSHTHVHKHTLTNTSIQTCTHTHTHTCNHTHDVMAFSLLVRTFWQRFDNSFLACAFVCVCVCVCVCVEISLRAPIPLFTSESVHDGSVSGWAFSDELRVNTNPGQHNEPAEWAKKRQIIGLMLDRFSFPFPYLAPDCIS